MKLFRNPVFSIAVVMGRACAPVWKSMVSMFVLLTTAVSAAQFGDFTYTDNGNTVIITDYSSSATGSVVIPSTIAGKAVTAIGDSAFAYCGGITSVTIPSGISSIPPNAFAFCSSLTSVTLPGSVSGIGNYAFYQCQKLQGMSLPASLSYIGNYAFNGCALTAVTVPAGTASIGSLAFGGCEELISITVDAANWAYTSLSGVLFNKSKTTLIKCPAKKTGYYPIPSGVTRIEIHAFESSRLNTITIPSSVTSIGSSAFANCEVLATITIPSSVTAIADGTFGYCYGLKNITIPLSVTSIGPSSFWNCDSLVSVTIPASVTNIGQAAFGSCGSLTSIVVDTNNPNFTSADGLLLDKSQSTLLQCPGGKSGDFRVPDGILSIGNSALGGCRKITRLSIPSTVTSIQARGFSGCIALTDITIPASVATIGDRAFEYCLALTQATFNGHAPTMGTSVFGASNVTVNYYGNKTGFTSPTWQGYPSVNMGDWIDSPQELKVEESPGGELVNGGTVTGLGSVPIGSSSVVTLTLTNAGTTDLSGLAVSIDGTHAGDFKVTDVDADYLVGGESDSIQITFTPKAPGLRTATLHISSNDEDESPFVLTLKGTGTAPEIDIEQPVGQPLVNGGTRVFAPTLVGKTSELAFTIKNRGTEDLSILTCNLIGADSTDFTVIAAPNGQIPGGGQDAFVVAFSPTAGGTRSTVLRIESNDANENPYEIHLTGRATVAPDIAVEQPARRGMMDGRTKKSFGTTSVGSKGVVKTFTIRNTGSATLREIKVIVGGRHAKDFVLIPPVRRVLLPRATTTFKIAFKPRGSGTRTAAVRIKSNDADENPFDIKLTGRGAAN